MSTEHKVVEQAVEVVMSPATLPQFRRRSISTLVVLVAQATLQLAVSMVAVTQVQVMPTRAPVAELPTLELQLPRPIAWLWLVAEVEPEDGLVVLERLAD
jgi:hypothetical protein